jgi:hypothetical protein
MEGEEELKTPHKLYVEHHIGYPHWLVFGTFVQKTILAQYQKVSAAGMQNATQMVTVKLTTTLVVRQSQSRWHGMFCTVIFLLVEHFVLQYSH